MEFVAGFGNCSWGEVTLAEAKVISTKFRALAAKAGTNSVVGSTPSTDDPKVSESEFPGCYDLDYGDGHTLSMLKLGLCSCSMNIGRWVVAA